MATNLIDRETEEGQTQTITLGEPTGTTTTALPPDAATPVPPAPPTEPSSARVEAPYPGATTPAPEQPTYTTPPQPAPSQPVYTTTPPPQPTYAPVYQPRERHYRGGLFFPVLLVGLGVVFLLNNMGVLDWTAWDFLWRMWPLLLVAAGLDLLIGRRSFVGSVIVVVLFLGLLGAGYAAWEYGAFGNGTLTTHQVSSPLNGATSGDVNIAFNAGTLRLSTTSDSTDLISGNIQTIGNETYNITYNKDETTGVYTVKDQGNGFPFFSVRDKTWDLSLNGSIPTKLRLELGAGSAYVNLQGAKLTSFSMNTGAGQSDVTLPQQGQLQANISGGVGEVRVHIPSGMAARINAKAGLGAVDVNGSYNRSGDSYISPNYDSAPNHVDLQVNSGVGHILIDQK